MKAKKLLNKSNHCSLMLAIQMRGTSMTSMMNQIDDIDFKRTRHFMFILK